MQPSSSPEHHGSWSDILILIDYRFLIFDFSFNIFESDSDLWIWMMITWNCYLYWFIERNDTECVCEFHRISFTRYLLSQVVVTIPQPFLVIFISLISAGPIAPSTCWFFIFPWELHWPRDGLNQRASLFSHAMTSHQVLPCATHPISPKSHHGQGFMG